MMVTNLILTPMAKSHLICTSPLGDERIIIQSTFTHTQQFSKEQLDMAAVLIQNIGAERKTKLPMLKNIFC